MSKMKKCQVVMLATNEKAEDCLLLSKNSKDIFYKKGYFTQSYLTEIGRTANHLYILSDDEIKIGDWYYNPSDTIFGGPHIEKCEYAHEAKACLNEPICLKIIATTDISLLYSQERTERGKFENLSFEKGIDSANFKPTGISQPSKSFIEKYIEEYNKGNIIAHVLVEYENFSFNVIGVDRPKVNSKDNTITIKKVKDSWSREEVIEIIKIIKSHSKESVEKWIEKNF